MTQDWLTILIEVLILLSIGGGITITSVKKKRKMSRMTEDEKTSYLAEIKTRKEEEKAARKLLSRRRSSLRWMPMMLQGGLGTIISTLIILMLLMQLHFGGGLFFSLGAEAEPTAFWNFEPGRMSRGTLLFIVVFLFMIPERLITIVGGYLGKKYVIPLIRLHKKDFMVKEVEKRDE